MAAADIATLDPDALTGFIAELHEAGFAETDASGRTFEGPIESCLKQFTESRRMSIHIRDGWPYCQPSVFVAGIKSWHVSHDSVCLWQEGDNTKRWITLDGIKERLQEWAHDAEGGFDSLAGAALDPQLYFESYLPEPIGIDEATLVGGLAQEGQHGPAHLARDDDGLLSIKAGKGATDATSGRWFYRESLSAPPKSLDDFQSSLTEKQRQRFEKKISVDHAGLFILIWPTPYGLASLILHVSEGNGSKTASALRPTPISQTDRLRRAGPDATALLARRIAIFGLGAIGSHVASTLARSGAGYLRLVDNDEMVPAIAVRHAAPYANTSKVDAVANLVNRFKWVVTDPVPDAPWTPAEIADRIADCDICVDATGNSLFTELLARVALFNRIPMVSVALYRGGSIARVRRQARGDHPIVGRIGHWRYPLIPVGLDTDSDFLGTETGCTAPVHNAPPSAVMGAAALCTAVILDLVSGRRQQPDDIIDVLRPVEPPFDRFGRFESELPDVLITDDARVAMTTAAAKSHPNETGGILIGLTDHAGVPFIVHAIELAPDAPTVTRYEIPAGLTSRAIESARGIDDRLGYVGEWHSHPTDQPASDTDHNTMRDIATASDCSEPVLIVVRPSQSTFALDVSLTINGELKPVRTLAVGPLESRSLE